jgi:hypothetical protein
MEESGSCTCAWGSKAPAFCVALVGLLMASGPLAAVAEDDSAGARGRRADRALRYFTETRGLSLDRYLKTLRPPGISAEAKARSLAMVRGQDIVTPSAARQAKLDALQPLLEYLERDSITDVRVLRVGLAWSGLLQGAAVLVSEEAIDLLGVEELQAVVAHELAHEYFAGEYERARVAQEYDTVKEIELRCDAVSIVTMMSLGREPEALLSGVSKLTRFNERHGYSNSRVLDPTVEERTRFGRAIIALVARGKPLAAGK